MIKNERQYRITKAETERFKRAISKVEAGPRTSIHPKLRQAEMGALRSQYDDLRQQLKEYEALRSGRRRLITLDSVEDLPKTLIQARIAAGLSQAELAAKLGVKPQQVQRYEATNYRSANLQRINDVVKALGITLREGAQLRIGRQRAH